MDWRVRGLFDEIAIPVVMFLETVYVVEVEVQQVAKPAAYPEAHLLPRFRTTSTTQRSRRSNNHSYTRLRGEQSDIMNDAVEDTTSKLAELLRNPDDLDKLPSLRSEFSRKKAAIDGQLKHGQSLEDLRAGKRPRCCD